ncbi:MAG: L,D-transpeptidase family protein [Oscillospiraceae bacterium]|nr:L,D-transpeptidase family protein [Oscillospiraceae bacterium]
MINDIANPRISFLMKKKTLVTIAAVVLIVSALIVFQPITRAVSGKYELLIIIDTYKLTLTLYENHVPIKVYPVAIGRWETPTPIGVFYIKSKEIPKISDMGPRFLRLSTQWGVYGIHGTSAPGSIGSAASHGCVRMFNRDVEELAKLVYVGTRVIIEGSPYGEVGDLPTLLPWSKHHAVVAVQRKLAVLGFYTGAADGTYGPGTSRALLAFKKERGLPAADIIDDETYRALGIMRFE